MAPLKVHTFAATSSEPHESTIVDESSAVPDEDDDGLIRGQRIPPTGESSRSLSPGEIEGRRMAAAERAQLAASAPDAPGNRRRLASPTSGLLKRTAPAPKGASAVRIDITSDIALRAQCLEMAVASDGLANPTAVLNTARLYLSFIMGTEEPDGDA